MEFPGFLLKKTLLAVVLPPGIFLVLFIVAILFVRERLRPVLFVLVLLLYLFCIEPGKDLLLLPLENTYPVPSWSDLERVEAIVVLGGGVLADTPDIDCPGTISSDSVVRLLGAYRLHVALRKPIIVTGGTAFGRKPGWSDISKKILVRLGVKETLIVTEAMSRDTEENARFVRDICRKRNWKRIALVTSACHMRRAMILFNGFFTEIVPFPTDYKCGRARYGYGSFLPDASNLGATSAALKEYLGITYYKLTLRLSG